MEQKTYNHMVLLAFLFSLISMSNTVTSTFSFNGSTMDMNGTTLENGTVPPDNTKVNKSGDTMTGSLNMGMKNITNGTVYQGQQLVAINLNSTSSPFYFPNDAKSGLGADYVGQFISESNSATMTMTSYGGDHSFEGSAYTGIRNRGNLSYGVKLLSGDLLFGIGGRGWHTDGGTESAYLSGSKIAFHMLTSQDWSSTAQGTKYNFYTTPNNSTTLGVAMSIGEDKNITVSGLAGSGNAYVCVNSVGKLYRGTPTC